MTNGDLLDDHLDPNHNGSQAANFLAQHHQLAQPDILHDMAVPHRYPKPISRQLPIGQQRGSNQTETDQFVATIPQ